MPSLQTGRSIRDQLVAAGRRVRVAPQLKSELGIQMVRTIFGKCYFDAEKCRDGIQAVRHHRYEVNEKEILHDRDLQLSTIREQLSTTTGGEVMREDYRASASTSVRFAERLTLQMPAATPSFGRMSASPS